MVPLTLHDFALFAPVQLDGQHVLAHLDTGAHLPMLSTTAAAAANFPAAPSKQIAGILANGSIPCVQLPGFHFLERSFAATVAVVHDSPHLAAVPFPVPITLGATTLYAAPLVLDFRQLLIGYVDTPVRPDACRIPIEQAKQRILFTLHAGTQPLQTIFDTGAGWSVLNSARLPAWTGLFQRIGVKEVQDAAGGSQVIGEVVQQPQLSVNGILIGRGDFLCLDLTPLETLFERQIDAIFGVNTMLTSACVWVLEPHSGILHLFPEGLGYV